MARSPVLHGPGEIGLMQHILARRGICVGGQGHRRSVGAHSAGIEVLIGLVIGPEPRAAVQAR